MRITVIAFTILAVALVFPSFGQQASQSPERSILDVPSFDPAVPTSPAFTILGVSPKDVTSPPDAEGFAVSLLNATDQNGVLQSGVAIDTNPYLVLHGAALKIDKYRTSRVQQFWSRMKLSIATTQASDDSQETRGALGLLFVPYNSGDPRLDEKLGNCLKTAIDFSNEPPIPPNDAQDHSQATPLPGPMQTSLADCHAEFVKRHKDKWDARSFMLGVAMASVTENGKVDSLQSDGVGIWASYSREFTLGKNQARQPSSDPYRGQWILHARYRTSEKVKPEGATQTIDQASSLFGARLRVGGPAFGGSLEGSYIRTEPKGSPSETHVRLILGAERLLFGGTWIEIGVGRDIGRKGGDDLVIRSALRWSFTQSRRFDK